MMVGMNEERRPDFLERHYTTPELAKAWHIPLRLVRQWFVNQPGVIQYGSGKVRKALRIPESVARRVYEEQRKKDDIS
jgi:hypothetical protein